MSCRTTIGAHERYYPWTPVRAKEAYIPPPRAVGRTATVALTGGVLRAETVAVVPGIEHSPVPFHDLRHRALCAGTRQFDSRKYDPSQRRTP